MPAKRSSSSLVDYLKVYGPALLVVVVGFVVAYQFVDPAPPKHIVIGTGAPDGAYFHFGERYRKILAREGVDLEVRATAGSAENFSLLKSTPPEVDVIFAQTGTEGSATSDELVSLGSLYFEPLWVFHVSGSTLQRLADLKGKRIAVGEEGSGTQAIALQLLADNGVSGESTEFLSLGGTPAAQALMEDRLDAVLLVASPQSSAVQTLLHAEGVNLMSLERAEGYTRVYRHLSLVKMPEGAIDLQANIPPVDVTLLAPTANLVVHEDFHPALIDLLLQAAAEVHAAGGRLEEPGSFPSPNHVGFPLSAEAKRHFDSGPPFLQRYLPFWAATLVDRLKVMLLPLLALLIPLFRIVPPTYRWRVRSKIYRWYGELEDVDRVARQDGSREELERHIAELDRIEGELNKISIPLSYREELYDLRLHIDLVRRQLRDQHSSAEAFRSC
jgi:TRAP transporter TAXI family solute receptor